MGDLLTGLGGVAVFFWVLTGLVVGLIWLITAIWVGFDAGARRQPGFPWFLLTAMFFPLGLAAWLVVRGFLPAPDG